MVGQTKCPCHLTHPANKPDTNCTTCVVDDSLRKVTTPTRPNCRKVGIRQLGREGPTVIDAIGPLISDERYRPCTPHRVCCTSMPSAAMGASLDRRQRALTPQLPSTKSCSVLSNQQHLPVNGCTTQRTNHPSRQRWPAIQQTQMNNPCPRHTHARVRSTKSQQPLGS